MKNDIHEIRYPRRRLIRGVLREVSRILFYLLTDLEISGQENLPEGGPLLVAVNHFSFVDPALVAQVVPWPLEVIGGFHTPNAPFFSTWILRLWGYLPVHRGTASCSALRAVEAVLAQGGVVGIAPEGGTWATVLRSPRPGAAFLAVRSGARILPVGIDGTPEIFPSLHKGQRAHVTVRIGEPFGPFQATGKGRDRRKQLDEIGHEIMRRIAALIPPNRQGFYSPDPAIRLAARGTEIYPWETKTEADYKSGEFF
jgi:1-acyl-sn-glycerol-3-phosphate acyltransferase